MFLVGSTKAEISFVLYLCIKNNFLHNFVWRGKDQNEFPTRRNQYVFEKDQSGLGAPCIQVGLGCLVHQRAGQLSEPGGGVSLRASSRYLLPLAVDNLSTGEINDDSWLKNLLPNNDTSKKKACWLFLEFAEALTQPSKSWF